MLTLIHLIIYIGKTESGFKEGTEVMESHVPETSTAKPVLPELGRKGNLSLAENFYSPDDLESEDPNFQVPA
jgi:hypothetical protein